MSPHTTLLLSYVLFIWLVVLHTFEEIACGIMTLQLGKVKLSRKKYLRAASGITTLNLLTLSLLILSLPAGYYLALFTSLVIGVIQFIVHGIGFIKEKGKMKGVASGFYSSIPLALAGLWVFVQVVFLM